MSERIPQQPPEIQPVPPQVNRPKWSVMIPTFNCTNYLIDTIKTVLLQDPGEAFMQIEVIDDFSTDADVAAVVQETGKGRVKYFRQTENVGSLRNFETCINRSRGHYVHILHGDDQVKAGFYKEIDKLFTSFPEAGAAFTGFTFVDEENLRLYDNKTLLRDRGLLKNNIIDFARSQLIQPPAMVVKRSVYEKLGSFYAVQYGEDWEMWVRIAAHYPIAHSPLRLALYRVHQNNITSRSFLSGQSMIDVIKVVDIMQQYLPPAERDAVRKYSKKHLSFYFALTSDKIYHQYGQPQVALAQAKRSMQMDLNHITLSYWLKIRLKILVGYKLKHGRKWQYSPLKLFR